MTHRLTSSYVSNYYYGIRRFPYAVKTTLGANGKPHNPVTFADIDPTQLNLTDGRSRVAPFCPRPHSRSTTQAKSGRRHSSKFGPDSLRGLASRQATSGSCSSSPTP